MLVIILPHQDDEIGVFHVIDECVHAKRSLLIVYVTDGAWKSTTAATRNTESVTALTRLGVARDDIWFLGQEYAIASEALRLHLDVVYSALYAKLSSRATVSTIYTPAWEGGHPDHDAAAMLALALGRGLGAKALQFPMYSAYHCGWRPY